MANCLCLPMLSLLFEKKDVPLSAVIEDFKYHYQTITRNSDYA